MCALVGSGDGQKQNHAGTCIIHTVEDKIFIIK